VSWAIPLMLDPEGRFPSARPDPLEDTVRLILAVAPGERALLPEFGWEGHFLDLRDPLQRQAAAAFAEEALRRWAPDLRFQRVDVLRAGEDHAELGILREGTVHRIAIGLKRRVSP